MPTLHTQCTLEIALKAAKLAADGHNAGDDDGTCNLDTPVFFPGRLRTATIQAAAEAAKVSVNVGTWGRSRCVFVYVTQGQANRRTRMAEAATRALKEKGLEAATFYQMD